MAFTERMDYNSSNLKGLLQQATGSAGSTLLMR